MGAIGKLLNHFAPQRYAIYCENKRHHVEMQGRIGLFNHMLVRDILGRRGAIGTTEIMRADLLTLAARGHLPGQKKELSDLHCFGRIKLWYQAGREVRTLEELRAANREQESNLDPTITQAFTAGGEEAILAASNIPIDEPLDESLERAHSLPLIEPAPTLKTQAALITAPLTVPHGRVEPKVVVIVNNAQKEDPIAALAAQEAKIRQLAIDAQTAAQIATDMQNDLVGWANGYKTTFTIAKELKANARPKEAVDDGATNLADLPLAHSPIGKAHSQKDNAVSFFMKNEDKEGNFVLLAKHADDPRYTDPLLRQEKFAKYIAPVGTKMRYGTIKLPEPASYQTNYQYQDTQKLSTQYIDAYLASGPKSDATKKAADSLLAAGAHNYNCHWLAAKNPDAIELYLDISRAYQEAKVAATRAHHEGDRRGYGIASANQLIAKGARIAAYANITDLCLIPKLREKLGMPSLARVPVQ